MTVNEKYQIDMKDNILIFRTASYKAEKGSILHSGVFSRELASFLAAGAMLTALGFFFVSNFKITVIHFIAAIFLFAVLALFFRTYMFHEANLEIVFDKGKGRIVSTLKKTVGKGIKVRLLSEVEGFRLGQITFKPENPDGVKVVENIALQHGTVIPGFGEMMEFYTVNLEFKQESPMVIFASGVKDEAELLIKKLKDFLGV